MAEKWQQWMPFKIDAFRGSPSVQAMHPAARAGYIYLLAAAWQSEDCTIPNDENTLSEISGLGEKLWKIYGPRILRKFGSDGQQRLLNQTLLEEWNEARRIFESRKNAAQRTNTARWALGERSVSDKGASRSAYTITGTVTEELKTSPKPRKKRVSEDGMVHSTNPRHVAFKGAIESYWKSKNSIPMPWDGGEGAQLGMWESANPTVTLEQFTAFLRNRFKSAVNHSERPRKWISDLTSYANGPLDKWGKPLNIAQSGDPLGGRTFTNAGVK